MELNGTSYLYNLSVIATTFAGFSGLTVIFREILGGKLTRLDSFVIRIFIQLGFMAAFGAILPPLFHLFELSPPAIWRAASILMALILGAWSFTYPMRAACSFAHTGTETDLVRHRRARPYSPGSGRERYVAVKPIRGGYLFCGSD